MQELDGKIYQAERRVDTCKLLCSSLLVTTCFLARGRNMPPQKELHRSLQVTKLRPGCGVIATLVHLEVACFFPMYLRQNQSHAYDSQFQICSDPTSLLVGFPGLSIQACAEHQGFCRLLRNRRSPHFDCSGFYDLGDSKESGPHDTLLLQRPNDAFSFAPSVPYWHQVVVCNL